MDSLLEPLLLLFRMAYPSQALLNTAIQLTLSIFREMNYPLAWSPPLRNLIMGMSPGRVVWADAFVHVGPRRSQSFIQHTFNGTNLVPDTM